MDAAFEITEKTGDLLYANGGIEADGGLKTAVLISLFSDARDSNQRGWWGGEIGSKLWTLKKAREYAENALSWLVDEQICKKVSALAEYDAHGRLLLSIELKKPDGTASYDFLWRNTDGI